MLALFSRLLVVSAAVLLGFWRFFAGTVDETAGIFTRGLPEIVVCEQIAGNITGQVYYPLSEQYISDSKHYMASSSQSSMCVVEVASSEDVSSVLKIVGETRTPFNVKSGGHASNPGFSSTPGVFISLVRLNQVILSQDRSTAEVGTGNVWTDVYDSLEGSGINVVGGRVNGPGVGGFTLGGGYSWLTNQYGLTCDTVEAYNLVLPNGTITKVDSSNSDLFFALKGGLNRFGIVTSVVFKTVPQLGNVYGGIQSYGALDMPALLAATLNFQKENTDPKAQVILTINSILTSATGLVSNGLLLLFYDGPNKPAEFDAFDKIPHLLSASSQTYSSFAKTAPSEIQAGSRGAFHTLMTNGLTQRFLNAVYNETEFYGALALLHGATFISYDVEPFMDYGKYATDSAFPHANSGLPLNLYYAWTPASEDAYWRGVMQQSVDYLTEVAKKEGIYKEDMYAYPNYALDTYAGPQIYGPENTARLRAIQNEYDPNEVMRLAGGFTI